MAIADEAEVVWGRKVSWGVTRGEHDEFFTTLSTPVMTRLRMEERNVLDTLIDAGVARSRSEALAWCVRLVGHHEADWIARLREAVATIEGKPARPAPRPPSARPGVRMVRRGNRAAQRSTTAVSPNTPRRPAGDVVPEEQEQVGGRPAHGGVALAWPRTQVTPRG